MKVLFIVPVGQQKALAKFLQKPEPLLTNGNTITAVSVS
jgi:hypothetical protein